MAWGVRHVALVKHQMVGGERHLASDGQGWAAFGLGKTPDGLGWAAFGLGKAQNGFGVSSINSIRSISCPPQAI